MTDSNKKVALITGASSGMGEATARKFAAGGYSVVIGARRKDKLDALAKSIGADVVTAGLDLTSPESISAFAKTGLEQTGSIDVFVNCAGIAIGREPADQADVGEWMNMIETDYIGPVRLVREILPSMRERGSGHIINIGALAALYPHPGSAVYASAKEAIRMFLKCVREDILGSNVRVTNIDPGLTQTEFAKVRFRGDEETVAKALGGIRMLEPGDVADCAWFAHSLPERANIDQLTVLPTDQTSPTRVHKA